MSEVKATRLSKIASEFNVGISTIVDFLKKKGHDIDANPNTKIPSELYLLLSKEYSSDISAKKESERVNLRNFKDKKETVDRAPSSKNLPEEEEEIEPDILIKDTASGKKTPLFMSVPKEQPKILGKIDVSKFSGKPGVSGKNKHKGGTPAKTELPKEKTPPPPLPSPPPQVEPVKTEETAETTPPVAVTPPPPPPLPSPPVVEKPAEEPVAEAPAAPQEPVVTEEVAPQPPAETPEVQTVERLVEQKVIDSEPKVIGKIDLSSINQRTRPQRKTKQELERERKARTQQYKASLTSKTDRKDGQRQKPKQQPPAGVKPVQENKSEGEQPVEHISRPNIKLSGPTVVGKIDLPSDKKTVTDDEARKKRKRIHKEKEKIVLGDKSQKKPDAQSGKPKKKKTLRTEINEEDVQKQIKETLSRLTSKTSKSKSSKYRRDKRDAFNQKMQEEVEQLQLQKNVLKVTEFVSVNELASLMNVPVTQVISTCMSMGLFVSINQRLDAEAMVLVADEFNYKVEFISVDAQDMLVTEKDQQEDLLPRPPIVTVMGHVDHGKTKLLDHIRNTNVIAGEAGGITQHIGAYTVKLDEGRLITFLDTPGHEAFTAMRARGARMTDVAIIVVAADDGVKQQTIEAINHASAAGVPIVFAINKIDKADANPDKVKEELAGMNYLVEDWGGKYQSQDISAKAGINIELLLEKVLLEAELLELKANPNKKAVGSVIESSLDKGRGYVATVLVQSGTLRTGDVVLAGNYAGHVKAMYNERNQRIEEAGPSTPVLVLGLDGAPQAGDTFNAMDDFREARDIAARRSQLQREQGMRTKKHITLEDIARRRAIGNFQELNVIVKGDVDGSIEALADSLIKLSIPEIQVNVIHKAVGQISESDVSLAAASNAVIVGFQVRPSLSARKLAEQEQIDIRIYSIIYDAIEEIKSAMEGMLSPEIKEEITATLEVLEAFRISKVGTIAGCIVREGKITRTTKVRIIRDGIVIHTGEIGSLKRMKEDVKEVSTGYECGLDINGFNDIQAKDIIEGYQEIEVKKKL
ncbi:MAG: translation initiation factor IF-2 [Bacteroidales bacterium]|jgi:translation initiation factor IF-2|nr:translation initiation factor IF-2 [Bacteroidales bacterium]